MKHILGLASNVKEDSLLTGLVQFFIDVGVLSEDSTNISDILTVDEFQIKIFIFLIGFFMLNILGIFVAWNYYGPRIADRLMKPVSLKVLEELKAGATELKLPAEHSPRI